MYNYHSSYYRPELYRFNTRLLKHAGVNDNDNSLEEHLKAIERVRQNIADGELTSLHPYEHKKALIHYKHYDGSTWLHVAASYYEYKVMWYLLCVGLDPEAKNNRGETPMAVLKRYGHPHYRTGLVDHLIVTDYLYYGIYYRIYLGHWDNEQDIRPALLAGRFDYAKYMIASGWQPPSVLLEAFGNEYCDILDFLIKYYDAKSLSVSLDTTPPATLLHLAANANDEVLVEKLLKAGVNPNVEDVAGRSPLHAHMYGRLYRYRETWICSKRSASPKIFALLLKYGLDPNSEDLNGSSLLDVCSRIWFKSYDLDTNIAIKKTIDLLLVYGARGDNLWLTLRYNRWATTVRTLRFYVAMRCRGTSTALKYPNLTEPREFIKRN